MRRPAAAALLALLVALAALAPALATATGPAAAAPADRSRPAGAAVDPAAPETGDSAALGGALAQTGDVAADTVVLRATVQPDGDAAWRIAYRIELTDENTTAAFESLRADIRENSSAYVDRFAARIESTVAVAENATGREMAATNFSVTARRDAFPTSTDYGVVVYTFTWKNFAATPEERIVAGDALAGLFLDSGTVLTVAWPERYEVRTVVPEPDERTDTSVTWRGERNFGPDQPRVTVAPASVLPVGPASLAAAAVVLLGVVGALLLRRRGTFPLVDERDGGGGLAADDGATVPPSGPDDAGTGAEAGATGDASGAGAAADADGATAAADASDPSGAGADADSGDGESDADATPPEELLSPHERVVRLVEDNGGRMKQADVTEELGWSAARTSQVVGDLRDDGTIESFRLGRENVLRLPDADDEPHPGKPDRPGDDE
ncbi:helix-turn-helix transcriptional regulator [Halobaculum sp. EA56]|uniref:helix-turn-helix transcriptional regulator n=1 Tax=Halobaculum sp. EA56 TaxID=3421648 RepID=UPI003EC156DE